MTAAMWAVALPFAAAAFLGYRLGARRVVIVGFAFAAGAGAATILAVAPGIVRLAAALAAAATGGRLAALALAGRRLSRERLLGAVLGVLPCLAVLALVQAPPRPPTSWLDGPIETMRAVRVLSGLSPAEALAVYEVPQVRAVAEDEKLRPLWEDLALVERMRKAAAGSRWTLLSLGTEAKVRAALADEAFRAKLRQVDLVALAGEVERRRREPSPAREETVPSTPGARK